MSEINNDNDGLDADVRRDHAAVDHPPHVSPSPTTRAPSVQWQGPAAKPTHVTPAPTTPEHPSLPPRHATPTPTWPELIEPAPHTGHPAVTRVATPATTDEPEEVAEPDKSDVVEANPIEDDGEPDTSGVLPEPPAPADIAQLLVEQGDADLTRALLDGLGDGVVLIDSERVVLFVNPGAETLFKTTSEQAVGKPVTELLDEPEGSSEEPSVTDQLLDDGHWRGSWRSSTSGERINVELTMTNLSCEDNAGGLIVARDISGLQHAKRAAEDQIDFASAVLESLPGRTCVIDDDGMVIAVNRQYRVEGPAGGGPGTGPGVDSDYLAWLADTTDADAVDELRSMLSGNAADHRTEVTTIRRRKRQYTELFAIPLGRESGGAVITHVDITARKQAEHALTRRATHDPLTGLPNRVLLSDRLAQALSRAARTKTQVGVLFCDLDGFRDVNNTHGHLAGDRLLVTIAKRLRAVCRSSDTVARVSGDEFVIILEDVETRDEIEDVARRVIEALSEPVELEQGIAKAGTSIGLVISSGVPRAGVRTVENLIRDADAAMYAAKEAGRGRFAWFSPEMLEHPRERPSFVQAIGRLLKG